MSGAYVFRRFRAAAGRFIGAREGNIAVIFALSAIPIISFVGAAIDYTRANAARSSMQAALDSTALMLSKDLTSGTINSSQITAKATAYFNALYNNKDALDVSVTATYTPPSGSTAATIKLDGSGKIVTDFMRVAGFPNMNFNTSSTTTWGNVRMRVAMVLDVTGSMAQDGKMDAMKPAAKALVDQLSGMAATAGDIYISIVPFAKDVMMGSSYKNATWIDWTDWDNSNGTNTCTGWNSWGSCNKWTWTPASHNTWTGCFTDRTQDYDTKNTAPTTANTATLFPASQYSYCDTNGAQIKPIMPLSYDWAALKARIDSLVPTGNTNQGIGLAWGWMTLTQSDPFNAPAKDANYVYKDAIVLLSDGLNTQNRWYNNANQIDARQRILCDNAKAAGITIYSIQVNTGGDPTSAVLQYCASNTSSFYLVTSASQTASVFNQIGTQLSKLRVSK
ncbi:pilus assembly protein TadG-related protein [Bradyrhizobium sp.]|uniref:pilus assembly protein TadG-related protein n=1 Tax=Bradyrhizobium sp. TaxID=376 RepID=UPI001D92E0F5|nr:pilus assembly protein TadG-related protein [Bradyrhizobium sp.]MBI5318250.1 TadE/TadG family protein [Bradyrhizobium sp.]